MMPTDNRIGARTWFTGIAAGVIIALGTSGNGFGVRPAFGQELDAPLVDRAHAEQLYRLIEQWVTAGTVEPVAAVDHEAGNAIAAEGQAEDDGTDAPRPAAVEPQTIRVSGTAGLRVTLRLRGVTLGTGEAVLPEALPADPDAPMPTAAHDLVELARSATGEALRAVQDRLADAELRALMSVDRGPGDLTPPTLADVASGLQVDLQVARRAERVHIEPAEPAETVYRRVAPGYHGLALIKPLGQEPSWSWPATALAANVSLRSQFVQLLSQQEERREDLGRIGRPNGPTLHRFEVIHLVRSSVDGPVTELVRGNRLLPPVSLATHSVEAMAQRLTRHLTQRLNHDPAILGTYLPTADLYDPPTAGPDELALALYALMRQTHLVLQTTPGDGRATALGQQIVEAATALAQQMLEGRQPFEPAVASLAVMILTESRFAPDRKTQRDALADELLKLLDDRGNLSIPTDERRQALNLPTQALIVAAMASLYDQTRDPRFANLVNKRLGPLWEAMEPQVVLTALPWLGQAQLRMSRLAGDAPAQAALERAQANYLGDLVDRLCAAQIVEQPSFGPADVVGGFELQRSPRGAAPSPDWRSAFVLSFVSRALREPRLTEGRDRLGWLLSCGLGARFLHQLMMDEEACFYVRSRPDALGGIRLALWDNRQPVSATAMGLLAITELQETLLDAQRPR